MFSLSKEEITRLRIHISELESYKELYFAEEEVTKTLRLYMQGYKDIILAKDGTIVSLQEWNKETLRINNSLKDTIEKQDKKLKNTPYYIGGGFIGGILLCLFLR